MIYSVFGDAGDKAVEAARCESGLNPNAISRYGGKGLFLFSDYTCSRWGRGNVFDPRDNSVAAFTIVRASGWDWHRLWPECA